MTGYSIGEAARRSGFSMDTLRYYEKIGLLVDVDRSSTGQRRFTEDDLGWLGTLKCLRDTGMPVADMLDFAELVRAGDHTIPKRVSLLETHHARVAEHIADLRSKHDGIAAKIDWYRGVLEV
ncbi:MAG: MerR family transcriptional regulator [Stackebrandtia sp.]